MRKSKNNNWISVHTKRPDPDVTVLAYDEICDIVTAWMNTDGEWESPEYGILENVTHWMPISRPKH